jgi:predicted Fe-Mo cluster-binding NifX family protein
MRNVILFNNQKNEVIMKIAIPVLENKGADSPISEHFGHAPYFAFIENDEISVIVNPLSDHGPGDIPQYMAQQKVDLLVARGIGGRAVDFFNRLGISVIRGASGTVKEILTAIKNQQLSDSQYEVKEKFHLH